MHLRVACAVAVSFIASVCTTRGMMVEMEHPSILVAVKNETTIEEFILLDPMFGESGVCVVEDALDADGDGLFGIFVVMCMGDPNRAVEHLRGCTHFVESAEVDGYVDGVGLDAGNLSEPLVPPYPWSSSMFPPWGQTFVKDKHEWCGDGVTYFSFDTGVHDTPWEFEDRVMPGETFCGAGPYSCVDGDDLHGHGTRTSSIAAGAWFGRATMATVVPVKVLGDTGRGSVSGLIRGIDWVLANFGNYPYEHVVVGMSLSAGPSNALRKSMLRLVKGRGNHPGWIKKNGPRRRKNGFVRPFVVVSAGNRSGGDSCDSFYAGIPGVISVGALDNPADRDGELYVAGYSCTGRCVDIFAPGSNIPGADPTGGEDGVKERSGTSSAQPHVAGAVACIAGSEEWRFLARNEIIRRLLNRWALHGAITGGFMLSGTPNVVLQMP